MEYTATEKIEDAWSETRYFAECSHCGAKNELDSNKCMSGAAEETTCEVCRKTFNFRFRAAL